MANKYQPFPPATVELRKYCGFEVIKFHFVIVRMIWLELYTYLISFVHFQIGYIHYLILSELLGKLVILAGLIKSVYSFFIFSFLLLVKIRVEKI